MVFLEGLLGWLIELAMKFLLAQSVAAVQAAANQIEKDKQEGIVNDANIKAYEAAQDRASRRLASVRLLNRDSSPPP